MKKETRGGKRINSGRKLLYGERTDYIGFCVPASKKIEIMCQIKQLLKTYKNGSCFENIK